ncbi:50S ribosomal protein L31 [Terrabacter sp. GCM10028922]|uniref:50S ribosomal protein L31 n=1 Tax=Terrabacter sp. GCM10028922 TaxID=3273428 RepID=UPI00362316BA
MKPGLHPRHEPVPFRDRSAGDVVISRSTRIPEETIEVDGVDYPVVHYDVTASSHPFWTRTARELDSEGRIERFRRSYGPRTSTAGGDR